MRLYQSVLDAAARQEAVTIIRAAALVAGWSKDRVQVSLFAYKCHRQLALSYLTVTGSL